MLNLHHITKSFPDNLVLDDVSLSLNAGEVIALIGENGVGKTTLLNIILGTHRPDAGTVLADHEAIGCVPQNAVMDTTIARTFGSQVEAWQRDYALALVGLEGKTLAMPVKNLSGGERTRLVLAKVLAADPKPTVLLLDEPTNNLDANGLAWLKQFVKSFKGGIILVSHDRTFINAVATKVIELRNGKLKQYGGNYDLYKQQKEAEQQAKLEHYQASVEERKRITKGMLDIQNRAQKGLRQKRPNDNDKAQFKWHQNNVQRTFSGQLKGVRSRLEQLEEVERPDVTKNYAIKLSGGTPSDKLTLRLRGIRKRYSTEVLRGVDLELRGNERVHLAGDNGNGKTTLLKIAAGILKPSSGTSTLGVNVRVGYFSQDTDGLDHAKTALENLQLDELKPTNIYREARSLGLTEQDLKKCVSELSRGQQAKLGIARLLFDAYQLLILDEPTNHLDIPAREQIEAALQDYNGAILFASHDNYLVKTLRPSKTLNLKNGKLQ